jgi:alkylation response protein AidB-like acyl-CoA dehydrogenase
MYQPPLKELRFVLHELIGDSRLSELPGYAEYSIDFADAALEEAGKFAQEVLDPINRVGDTEGAKWTPDGVVMPQAFKDAYKAFVEGGWPTLRAPQVYGGQGAPTVLGTAIEELWGSSNLAFKLCPMLTQGAIEALERCGSEAQKKKYIPKMVTGEWTGTMNLTEPHAGSDLGVIRTRAVPEGDHYRIYGQKIFITYGDQDYTSNIIHMVLARIDGAPAGTKGISLFIVPKFLVNDDGSLGERNDVRCVSIEHKLGIHASPTCVMSYGDKTGAIGYLVGEPNRGLQYMFIMMNAARLAVGLEGWAIAERAYQQALEWSRTRIQGRPPVPKGMSTDKPLPIGYHADVKRMLLTMKAHADAGRAIGLYAAFQLDIAKHAQDEKRRAAAQARGDLLIPIVKGWSTEIGVLAASLGIQVHGGMGFIEETGAAQYYRDARITPIYEGTTGIQAGDLIGRKVGRDGGAAMSALIEEMTGELKAIKNDDAGLQVTVKAALEGIGLLRDATDALLKYWSSDVERAQAVAVPYLMLSGYAIGGWLLAKSHDIAIRKRAEDTEFYTSKAQLARFYAEQVLPNALSLARVVTNGTDSVMAADPAVM